MHATKKHKTKGCLILHHEINMLRLAVQWRAVMLPDRYIDHGSQMDQTQEAGLSSKDIAATVLSLIGKGKDSFQLVNL